MGQGGAGIPSMWDDLPHRHSITDPDLGGALSMYGWGVVAAIIGCILGCLCFLFAERVLTPVWKAILLIEWKRAQGIQNNSSLANDRGLAAPDPSQFGQGKELSFPETCMHDQFFAQAEAYPADIAVSCRGATWDFGSLQAAAQRAATQLSGAGVCPGSTVALFLDGGVSLVISILGTWIAGGAWFPIDHEAPEDRASALMKEGDPVAVICDDAQFFRSFNLTVFNFDSSEVNLIPITVSPNSNRDSDVIEGRPHSCSQTAQVIYTSGSTGVPKGVIFSHKRLSHACKFFADANAIGRGSRVLQKTPYIWSVFRHELYPALCRGGMAIMANPKLRKDPSHIADLLRTQRVSVAIATPTVLDLALDAVGGPLPDLKVAVCMGEGLKGKVAAQIYSRVGGTSFQLYNYYGSTETENTVFAVPRPRTVAWNTVFSAEDARAPAGKPQPCISIHIVDSSTLELVANGGRGEICFGGVMSDGYWRRAELTAERFVDHPSLGRIYRTGDIGIFNANGDLEVVGRMDRQVKVRGIRIELEEVEAKLWEATSPLGCTESAAVAASVGGMDHLQVVAFVAPADLDIAEVRKAVEAKVPPALVPSAFVAVENLPRLANHKVDLKKLEGMAQASEETVQVMDSLGNLQALTRGQVEDTHWVNRQQAFWMILVMADHFKLYQGAACEPYPGKCSGVVSENLVDVLGHGRDMVAFMMLMGFTDSRVPAQFTSREVVLLATILIMRCIDNSLHRWFLYSALFARCLYIFQARCGIPPRVQVFGCFLAAFLFPDDVWQLVPDAWLKAFRTEQISIIFWGFRYTYFLLPAFYLTGIHYVPVWVKLARAHAPALRWKAAMLCGGCWASYVTIAYLDGSAGGYPTRHAIYDTDSESRYVTIEYMLHPSAFVYTLLWLTEVACLAVPAILVGTALAYVPWQSRIIGTTTFGNYILHPFLSYTFVINWARESVVTHITSPNWSLYVNVAVLVIWNFVVSILFALTLGAAFHHGVIYILLGLRSLCVRAVAAYKQRRGRRAVDTRAPLVGPMYDDSCV